MEANRREVPAMGDDDEEASEGWRSSEREECLGGNGRFPAGKLLPAEWWMNSLKVNVEELHWEREATTSQGVTATPSIFPIRKTCHTKNSTTRLSNNIILFSGLPLLLRTLIQFQTTAFKEKSYPNNGRYRSAWHNKNKYTLDLSPLCREIVMLIFSVSFRIERKISHGPPGRYPVPARTANI